MTEHYRPLVVAADGSSLDILGRGAPPAPAAGSAKPDLDQLREMRSEMESLWGRMCKALDDAGTEEPDGEAPPAEESKGSSDSEQ